MALVGCFIQPSKENKFISTESEEVAIVFGDWRVMGYLGQSVEYHGVEANSEAEMNEKNINEVKEKYLEKRSPYRFKKYKQPFYLPVN